MFDWKQISVECRHDVHKVKENRVLRKGGRYHVIVQLVEDAFLKFIFDWLNFAQFSNGQMVDNMREI